MHTYMTMKWKYYVSDRREPYFGHFPVSPLLYLDHEEGAAAAAAAGGGGGRGGGAEGGREREDLYVSGARALVPYWNLTLPSSPWLHPRYSFDTTLV